MNENPYKSPESTGEKYDGLQLWPLDKISIVALFNVLCFVSHVALSVFIFAHTGNVVSMPFYAAVFHFGFGLFLGIINEYRTSNRR